MYIASAPKISLIRERPPRLYALSTREPTTMREVGRDVVVDEESEDERSVERYAVPFVWRAAKASVRADSLGCSCVA